MKTSEAGIQLIKDFEGLELESYQDIAGVWTIGYGHTETAGPNQKISEREAEALLRRDLKPRERAVDQLTNVPINQNEFDALVSFVYNVGIDAYRRSTARRLLNRGDRGGAADALTWWNKATINGVLQEVRGLTRRRAAERALFLKPVNPPIVANQENVDENSRVTPVEDSPRRSSLGESRTIQGATVAGGAGAAAATMGRDSAQELDEIETDLEAGMGADAEHHRHDDDHEHSEGDASENDDHEEDHSDGESEAQPDVETGSVDVAEQPVDEETADAASETPDAGVASEETESVELPTGVATDPQDLESEIVTEDPLTGDPSGAEEGAEATASIDEDTEEAPQEEPEAPAIDEAPGDPATEEDAITEPSVDDQIATEETIESTETAPLPPAKHERHQADAQIQLALLFMVVLSVLYIFMARFDDWRNYRR